MKNLIGAIKYHVELILYRNYYKYIANRTSEYTDDTNYCIYNDNSISTYNFKCYEFIVLDVYNKSNKSTILGDMLLENDIWANLKFMRSAASTADYIFIFVKTTILVEDLKRFEEMMTVLKNRAIFLGYTEYPNMCKKHIWPYANITNDIIKIFKGDK